MPISIYIFFENMKFQSKNIQQISTVFQVVQHSFFSEICLVLLILKKYQKKGR